MTLEEADTLRPGDPVEWEHPRGGWRRAKFVAVHPERRSVQITTDVGCVVFRRVGVVRRATPSPQDP